MLIMIYCMLKWFVRLVISCGFVSVGELIDILFVLNFKICVVFCVDLILFVI